MDGLVLRSVEHCMLSWSELSKIHKSECKEGSKVVKSKVEPRNIAAIMLMSCNQYFRLCSFQAVSVSINYTKSIILFLFVIV